MRLASARRWCRFQWAPFAKAATCPAVQVITLDHDKYMHELENIAQCHNKSLQARDKLRLRAVTVAGAAASNLTARVPKMYEALGEQTGTPVCKCMVTCSYPCNHSYEICTAQVCLCSKHVMATLIFQLSCHVCIDAKHVFADYHELCCRWARGHAQSSTFSECGDPRAFPSC